MLALPQPVLPAEAFADALGVNVHFTQDWRSYAAREVEVTRRLGELGAKHIRDGLDARPEVAARFERLARKGVRALLIVGPRMPSKETWRGKLDLAAIPAQLEIVKRLYPLSCEAIEGPNEYDVNHDSPEAGIGDPAWAKTYAEYTRALWRAVRADPALRGVRVLNGPMAHAFHAPEVGDLSAFVDFGSFHPYPGGRAPSGNLEGYNLAKTREMVAGKPFWATETGYHNAIFKPLEAQGHNPVPEAVAGIYAPRLVAEYLRLGIARSYFYELVDGGEDRKDQEQSFGLMRSDFTPKPAFLALKATMGLVRGGTGRGSARTWSVEGAEGDVRLLPLVRRDGTMLLMLWREAPVWDEIRGAALTVEPRAVRVSAAGTVYRPSSAGETGEAFAGGELKVRAELTVVAVPPAPHG